MILTKAAKLFQSEHGEDIAELYLRKIIRDTATSFFFGYDQFIE